MPLPTKTLGPFSGGVVDAANPIMVQGQGRGSYPGLGGKPVVRYARNCQLDGMGRLIVRAGTQLALTLMDDQGTPAPVTSVVAHVQFADGSLAVGHSTVTQKFYLYWLTADLTNWYNSSKVLQNTTSPAPVAVLWTGAATPAPVLIAEGLNLAFIAHNNAGVTFNTQQFDTTQSPAVLSAYQANLDGGGLKNTYFRGVVSFQQHLWGWGYGSQAPSDGDRPELLRFSTPFFGPMSQVDNFGVGHRTRSRREAIVDAVVSGQVLYVGTNFSVWPITGFGRNSWDKSRPIDESYGFWGLHSACAGPNGYLYYWSHHGPLRVIGQGPPEPLWPRVAAALLNIVENTPILAAYNEFLDQVQWIMQTTRAPRVSVLCVYDVIREAFLGPDGDYGVGVGIATVSHPVLVEGGAALVGPAGPPTNPSVDGVGSTVARAHWTDGDLSPDCTAQLEYRTPPGAAGVWSAIPNPPNPNVTFTDVQAAWGANQFAGQQITIISGTGAGQSRTIISNTLQTLVVSVGADGQQWGTNPDATSHYQILPQATGLATAATPTTLSDSSQVWTPNQFAGQEVAIVQGTGVGQKRTIIANTSNALTISTGADGNQWATVPDGTSRYRIAAPVTSATTTTLTNSALALTPNTLIGQTVLILAGTGAGQLRTVLSNTATTITVSNGSDGNQWTTTPDATSRYQVVATSPWIIAAAGLPVSAANSYQFTGLAKGTTYQWRVKDVRNGISSTYLGPTSPTTFTTTNQLNPPTVPGITNWTQIFQDGTYIAGVVVSWVNSGESGVSTEVYLQGPQNNNPGQAALTQPGNLQATVGPGVSSWPSGTLDQSTQTGNPGIGAGTYWAAVRHVRTGAIPSTFTQPDVSALVP